MSDRLPAQEIAGDSSTLLRADPVIESLDIRGGNDVIILDVRGAGAFAKGHVKGAIRVPLEKWEAAAKSSEISLENADYWVAEIGGLGISGAHPVAIYDDGRMTEGARVWFILQHFGVRARVVNGGWPALLPTLAQTDVEKGPGSAPEPVAYKAWVGPGPVGLVDKVRLLEQLGSETRVLDSRTAAEFAGDDQRRNPRGGHLPGAIHLAHNDLLDVKQRLRPARELAALLSAAGFKDGDHVVTHCESGGRAALAALAAVRASYRNVEVYYLSFADWAKDESCPVVRD